MNDAGEKRSLKPIAAWAAVILFHFAASAVANLHLLRNISSWGQGPDLLLYSYLFGWDWHALITDPAHLFDANIFYPAKNALASSDHRLGELILWVIPWLITKRQFLSDGIAVYLTYALTGVTVHIWVRKWTGDHVTAAFAAVLANLNPLRLYNAWAVHVIGVFWLPLCLYFMDEYLVKRGRRNWALMVAFFWLQFMVSFYPAYSSLLLLAAYYLCANFFGRIADRRRVFVGMVAGCVVLAITLAPFVIPYFNQTAGATDRLRVLVTNSPYFPDSFLSSYPRNWFWGLKMNMITVDEKIYPLWMGIGLPLFAIAGLWSWWRSGDRIKRNAAISLFASSAFIFVLSLGPLLKTFGKITPIPLPFLPIMKIAPGLDKMHTPFRLLFVMTPMIAPLVAIGAAAFIRRLSRGGVWLPGKLAAFALLGMVTFLDVYQYMDPPPAFRIMDEPREVTRYLAQSKPEGAMIELPFPTDYYLPHTMYMVQGLHHFIPLANGYGSFFPQTWKLVGELAAKLPDENALDKLAKMGITTFVLHTNIADFARAIPGDGSVSREVFIKDYPMMRDYLGVSPETVAAFRASPRLIEEKSFPYDIVFRYVPKPDSSPMPEAKVLRGTVKYIVPADRRTLLVGLSFVGDGGKWINRHHGESLQYTMRFLSPDDSRDIVEPLKFRILIPYKTIADDPFDRDVPITRYPPPGRYLIRIESPDGVAFEPVYADLVSPH